MSEDLDIDGVVIPGSDLSWTAVRSSGPGGQNVNKVSTKIVLRFDLPGCEALLVGQKQRLRNLAAGRLDADGCVVITSQITRNRVQNLEDARDKLAGLIRKALVEPKRRRKTKPSAGARKKRLADKRHKSDKKRDRARVE